MLQLCFRKFVHQAEKVGVDGRIEDNLCVTIGLYPHRQETPFESDSHDSVVDLALLPAHDLGDFRLSHPFAG